MFSSAQFSSEIRCSRVLIVKQKYIMRYLYSAFLRPKQSRSATELHVLTGSHSFLTAIQTTILTLLRRHSPHGTTRTRQNTSDIDYYPIYPPRKDDRLSWPSWQTYSGRLTRIRGHPSAAGRAWDRKVRRSKTNVLPLCNATNQIADRTDGRTPDDRCCVTLSAVIGNVRLQTVVLEASNNDEKMQTKVLKCLVSWLILDVIPQQHLMASKLLSSVFSAMVKNLW